MGLLGETYRLTGVFWCIGIGIIICIDFGEQKLCFWVFGEQGLCSLVMPVVAGFGESVPHACAYWRGCISCHCICWCVCVGRPVMDDCFVWRLDVTVLCCCRLPMYFHVFIIYSLLLLDSPLLLGMLLYVATLQVNASARGGLARFFFLFV